MFVEADLPLPTVGVLVGPDPLGAVVKFDEEVELLPVGQCASSKAQSGKRFSWPTWSRKVFSRREVLHGDALPMGGDGVWTMKSARQCVW